MTLDQVLKYHSEGSIATREAAQRTLQHITVDNKAEVLARIKNDPFLEAEIMELVRLYADLTDAQWDGFITCEPGAYTRPLTLDEEAEREARYKEEHRNMRRGVEALK